MKRKLKKWECRNCGNCKHREVYHLKYPCNSCVKENKLSLFDHWELED